MQLTNRITFLLLASALISISVNPQTSTSQDKASKADEYLSAAVKMGKFSGAVLLAREGKVVLRKGYGLANLELGVPNTPKTKFRLGSMTKQFTAMGILILQERGKLKIEDSICKYLPDCAASWKDVTIHHLLTHTSGIAEYLNLEEFRQHALPLPTATVIETLKTKPLDFKPGERFSYSNSGYYLLGCIIEKSSGKSYEAFLQESIFAPLQMTDTGYDSNKGIIPNRASGYVNVADKFSNASYLDMSVPYAAGGLYSTVEDLLRWDQALYSARLVSRKSLEQIFAPHVKATLRSLTGSYGYGWMIGDEFNHKALMHAGNVNGFSSFIARFPNDKATVIVLSNLENAPFQRIAHDLAAIMFGEKYELLKERIVAKVDPRIYDAYEGKYSVTPAMVVTLVREGDKLMATVAKQRKIELLPETETDFFVKGVDATLKVVKDEKGEVTGLILNQFGVEIKAKKVK
jgi:CubicO group peptidase (beta-lactamase class C family)